ncbi:alpha/beta fold hydrolase [Pseudoalteromonas fenneropenaei]|uniref:Alpha/beta fold hydrolase n=1 Tax=Pseudoalteromonas fenneropenaei TaxID=1737459 RepID=A0ABV7CHC4_9GAMM
MQLNYKLFPELPSVTADQATFNIEKPCVVLLHGLFGSLENLNIIAKALAEQFQVINFDLRNHGQSPHHSEHDYPLMANDVIETLHTIGVSNAHFVGHSMGGKVAMQVAMQAPTLVNKLVVLDIAPVAYHSRHNSIIEALSEVSLNKVSSRSDADALMSKHIAEAGVRQFLLKSLAKDDSGNLTWRFNLTALKQHYGKIIGNIDANDSCLCETLFIKGSNSDYILAEHREIIAKLFPNSKGKIIHGAGHWLHAEKPVAVNKSIVDFLQ